MDYGGDWVNTDSNFDNVYLSMISLFNIMTTEGWIDVMWSAVDSTEIDYVPIASIFNLSVVFFLIIIFFFHLFILNMFVGIVINVFSDEKKTLEVDIATTEELASQAPADRILVAESGLNSRADLDRMALVGAHCALVGESLMRQEDVSAATRLLLEGDAPHVALA